MAQPDTNSPKQFPTQRLDEKPILVMHRHWIALAKFWLEAFAFTLLPVVFVSVLYGFEIIEYDPDGFAFVAIVLSVALMLLFIIGQILHHWVDYYLDIWAITDQRIVSIELAGLFNRVISELPIDKVQDVTSEIKGVLATALNYGNVFIQTAAEKERFQFEEIPYPQKVQQAVLRIHDQFLAAEKKEEAKGVAQAMAAEQAKTPQPPQK